MTIGWLFDAYTLNDKIILWIKNKILHRIEHQWTPSIFVASDSKSKLSRLETNTIIKPFVKEYTRTKKFEHASDLEKSQVLRITVNKSSEIVKIAKNIERLEIFGAYRLYNVNIPPEQTYLYENNLYPLGKYQIKNNTWEELSKIYETD